MARRGDESNAEPPEPKWVVAAGECAAGGGMFAGSYACVGGVSRVADKTHVTLLKQGVTAWNEWRAGHRETRPDLSDAHLYGLDLGDANLARTDLRYADLRGTALRGARLNGADLQGADLFRTVLDGADLTGANLHGVQHLSCPQLVAAQNWQSGRRDAELACGAPIRASGAYSGG
jgi:hypothetical protein